MDTYITNEFRRILKRMYLPENDEKRRLICTKTCNEDEERVWKLCRAFWPTENGQTEFSIEEYVPNQQLDRATAKRYIKELDELLDKLGWR